MSLGPAGLPLFPALRIEGWRVETGRQTNTQPLQVNQQDDSVRWVYSASGLWKNPTHLLFHSSGDSVSFKHHSSERKKSDATLLENPDLNWHLCFEIWQLVSSRFKLVIIWQTSHYGLKASFLLFMKHLRPHFYFKFSTDHKNEFEQWFWLNTVSGSWSKTWSEMQIQTHFHPTKLLELVLSK